MGSSDRRRTTSPRQWRPPRPPSPADTPPRPRSGRRACVRGSTLLRSSHSTPAGAAARATSSTRPVPPWAPLIFLAGGPGSGETGPWAPPGQRHARRAADHRLAARLTFSASPVGRGGPRQRRAGPPPAPRPHPTESLGILCGRAEPGPALALACGVLDTCPASARCERRKMGGARHSGRVRGAPSGWLVATWGSPPPKAIQAGAGGYDGWDRGEAGPGCQRA